MNIAAATAELPILDAIVIGAGISGLAVAHGLAKRALEHAVLESGPRAGGVIGTGRRDGFLYEMGPNSTLDTTPLINELLLDLGIAGDRVDAGAVATTRYVVRNGKLVALPTTPAAFLSTPAFTLAAKLRLLGEPFVPRTPPGIEESIATFVQRRLGTEFLDYAIDPFVAGIYAGDPERVSVAAAFPRLLALEQQYGSLIKGQVLGARQRRKNRKWQKTRRQASRSATGCRHSSTRLPKRWHRSRWGRARAGSRVSTTAPLPSRPCAVTSPSSFARVHSCWQCRRTRLPG